MISIIVAIASNNAIGKNNDLLWHLPNDLKRFKRLTTGHKIIMGRNTFLSLPIRPLPNRTSIVITDDKNDHFPGASCVYSVEEAIQHVEPGEEAFIIGGGMVYKQFLPLAAKLYLTLVHHDFDADTFFPEINYSEWEEIERTDNKADDKFPFDYTFLTLVRKNSGQ